MGFLEKRGKFKEFTDVKLLERNFIDHSLHSLHIFMYIVQQYVLNRAWGEPTKLIQVVSTSEFHEY